MKTILLIDGGVPARGVLRELLVGSGYLVHTAGGGAEAFELLHTLGSPDLILLDTGDSSLDGEEFVEALQADAVLAAIPILVLGPVVGGSPTGVDGLPLPHVLDGGFLETVRARCR